MSSIARPAGMEPAPSLIGFEHYHRYWFRKCNCFAVKIKPGEFYVTRSAEAITTVLGSCVAACVRDPVAGVGGMNHFILPDSDTGGALSESSRYGAYAMEQLINEVMKFGGVRERLEIKVTGGGNMMQGMSDIGALNAQFVTDYLRMEGFHIVSSDLGGDNPRNVAYLPMEGRMLVKKLATLHNSKLLAAEGQYQQRIDTGAVGGEVELF
ncbi:chemoreceptor glutamine deamidase CheD [Neptunomonas sp. XY-337]|uniref:chemoreceptor glutamine deamidase CheD n=1 Tax=Neptunomonas sp. XY-337 TaxID=2561897 RepID=UPI00197DA338|nr:chemoreceptor glutamine deamidase CheD [Neptunomonas sp. XY-337]